MSDGERLVIPGWFRVVVVASIAVIGGCISLGWKASSYANEYLAGQTRIEAKVDDLRDEFCAQRRELGLKGWSKTCGFVTPASFRLPAQLPDEMDSGGVSPLTVIGIVSGALLGVCLLACALNLILYLEVRRSRARLHDHDSMLTAVCMKLDLEMPKAKR